MKTMLSELKAKGYKHASLAVQKANYAVKMYQNVGFKVACENDEEYIMLVSLTERITLCGDNCLGCPRYLAKTEDELNQAAELWYRMGWREKLDYRTYLCYFMSTI